MATAMIALRGSQKANSVAGVMGLYMYARRTSPRVIETFSRMSLSISYKSVHTGVLALRRDALARARAAARNERVPFMPTHDNLQFSLQAGQITLVNHKPFLHTTTAFITPMFKATHETMAVDPLEPPGFGSKGVLTLQDVTLSTKETSDMRTAMVYHVMSILVELSGVPEFSVMRKELRTRMPVIHPIELHKTEIFPLSAMPLNEVSQKGNRKVLETVFQTQLKIPSNRVRLFLSDSVNGRVSHLILLIGWFQGFLAW